MSDARLNDFSRTEAAFILSGVEQADKLQNYVDWHDELVEKIKGFRWDTFDDIGMAAKVFNYLRTMLYDEYKRESTTLLDIVDRRQYNCVSSTILYNTVCDELGIFTEAFETPTHVYSIFANFGREIIVENTHPMGFNITGNLHAYSQYLASFYPEDVVYKIGLDRLYLHENSKGRVITNTELLGLLAYNQAYFALQRKDYSDAYRMTLLAQNFNGDSRSNVSLELNLYYKWGERCFLEKKFFKAFQVLADGVYRYPNEKGLAENSRAAFINLIHKNWVGRNWRQTLQSVNEINELEILQKEDLHPLKIILSRWLNYFHHARKSSELKQVELQIKKLFGKKELKKIKQSFNIVQ